MIDVEQARRETPGCEFVAYFDNAGASLPPKVVLDTVLDHLRAESTMGGYQAEQSASERLEAVYDSIAALIGCNRTEVAFADSATRAWDMAFYGIPWRPGDRILTAHAEYASNVIAFLQIARRHGVSVDIVRNDDSGQLSVTDLANLIDERVRLIAMSHVPTHGGLVNPAVAVGRVARDAGVLYLLDACQSVGQLPLDVRAIGCHFLSATGRKYLRGPRGTGFLYVDQEVLEALEPPFLDLHSASWVSPREYRMRDDARRFELWESYVAGKLGLGKAVDYTLGWGIEDIARRVVHLAGSLRTQLDSIRSVRTHDLGVRRCGIVTFTKDGIDPSVIVRELAARQIVVNTATSRASLFDFPERGLSSVVRASVHYFNTEVEIDSLCETVAAI
jgi:cysteine desulfurase / selenocysteine lyase